MTTREEMLRQHVKDWRLAAATRLGIECREDTTWAAQQAYARALTACADAIDQALAAPSPAEGEREVAAFLAAHDRFHTYAHFTIEFASDWDEALAEDEMHHAGRLRALAASPRPPSSPDPGARSPSALPAEPACPDCKGSRLRGFGLPGAGPCPTCAPSPDPGRIKWKQMPGRLDFQGECLACGATWGYVATSQNLIERNHRAECRGPARRCHCSRYALPINVSSQLQLDGLWHGNAYCDELAAPAPSPDPGARPAPKCPGCDTPLGTQEMAERLGQPDICHACGSDVTGLRPTAPSPAAEEPRRADICGDREDDYVCNLPLGHAGQHRAIIPALGREACTWPNHNEPPSAPPAAPRVLAEELKAALAQGAREAEANAFYWRHGYDDPTLVGPPPAVEESRREEARCPSCEHPAHKEMCMEWINPGSEEEGFCECRPAAQPQTKEGTDGR